ncbi:ribosomal RNA small subunit methyltransferase A [Adlercreutzia equolifaciens]|uniref:ribosomal RNA small subunit methyltransferase A n=1 Tax=Adlercreutzia equolifaciens TaxID=446660 RepID=UPI001EDEE58A|nr:rRNA adenine dimethyltransferase family protein [uncultured Adlercreutzia sp.]MCG4824388.1 16S rRNA (adenine(1518)-N(6)/adenine(1519)-N(6))-dimethyltransferase [Adlercreutzia equolifaciens]MDR3996109.1 rRNA adenine dimethyltransferase family protein [Adlercreutzia sp.]MED9828216.1 rRNA adenine dimethyltransferase family protein [Adlercreutzia sp.]MEE0582120.1 rRNA adenine dimethyltransferase family protein [Adlercreutzia sp.]
MVAIDSYAGGDGRLSPLSTPSATRAVLEAHGIGTKYTLGQNFLVNDDVLKKIVALAEVGENDRILEVGPGIGTLTIALLKHAASVIAIERDPDLPAVLADTLHPWREKFALIEKDALDVTRDDIVSVASTMVEPGGDAGCLDRASSAANETAQWAVSQSEDCLSESRYRVAVPQEELRPSLPSKLVANLPYAVAATVVLDYFESFPFLDSATIMVQKEVADRMAAAVGTKNYGAYTVKLGLYVEPAGRFAVGPGNFFPPPRVDSAVIRLNRRVPLMADGAPASPEVIAAAALMADAAFTNRRKTIANSCKTYFSGRGPISLGAGPSAQEGAPGIVLPDGAAIAERLAAIFDAATIDPRRRGETLTQQEFLALGAALLKVTAA